MTIKKSLFGTALFAAVAFLGNRTCIAAAHAMETPRYFLPGAAMSRFVSISSESAPSASITILTQSVAIKETGPAVTVNTFGEVYSFSPSFFAVQKDRPTRLTFWNLQQDDEHQFFLLSPDGQPLMFVELPPLKKTSYVLTFHKEGIYTFQCPMHGEAMSGQILVR